VDGLDVAGGGGDEDFVTVASDNDRERVRDFDDGNAEARGEFEHEGSGDAGEAAAGEGRGFEAPVADDEDVAAGAFAELAFFIGEEAFTGAVAMGEGEGADVFGVGDGLDAGQGARGEAGPGAEGEGCGGRPGVDGGGGDAEGLGIGAALAAGGAGAAGEGEAEAGVGELIGAEDFAEGCLDQVERGWCEVEGIAGSDQTLPVAGEGVGLAVAGENGFEDAVTDEEAVVHGGDTGFGEGQEMIVPPENHGEGGDGDGDGDEDGNEGVGRARVMRSWRRAIWGPAVLGMRLSWRGVSWMS
jgi:hypothetical protein